MKITPANKKEIKKLQTLHKQLDAIEKQIKLFKRLICGKRCPFKYTDIIALPDDVEGLVLHCEAFSDYSDWQLDYPDKIEFSIRYLPIRRNRLLRESRVTRKWRDIVLIERDSQRAKDLLRKWNGVEKSHDL